MQCLERQKCSRPCLKPWGRHSASAADNKTKFSEPGAGRVPANYWLLVFVECPVGRVPSPPVDPRRETRGGSNREGYRLRLMPFETRRGFIIPARYTQMACRNRVERVLCAKLSEHVPLVKIKLASTGLAPFVERPPVVSLETVMTSVSVLETVTNSRNQVVTVLRQICMYVPRNRCNIDDDSISFLRNCFNRNRCITVSNRCFRNLFNPLLDRRRNELGASLKTTEKFVSETRQSDFHA